jgi:stage V sporulation protein AC
MSTIDHMKGQYQEIVKKHSPQNELFKNAWRAFWVGGSICLGGQLLTNYYRYSGFSKDDATTMTTITLIFLAALFTALNIYDELGNYAGGGSIIPITGFANSMVSAAMEYKKEGYIYGIGSRLFSVAGPVIVYGIISSVAIGVIYYFL